MSNLSAFEFEAIETIGTIILIIPILATNLSPALPICSKIKEKRDNFEGALTDAIAWMALCIDIGCRVACSA
ncbi:MAG: hypothetical protein IGR93_14095 [Hydrococcus sp. C42_A2020_068]|uniref:hypothetical protein n=1 Tax=Pleurocapsa sp. PCC 7327 TaxID=118163 RepID=UPI00029FCA5A|nr:hypothetical protein [Pleurocapsa sp. PCC 7327]AFY79624.1 hypothetical protein Ple7327_4524 [Pleurocapsa sp. PCC 7327]MBF2021199.1 hypothetical protein [Hydrococcus sp. C42_A2020_068]